MLIYDFFTQPIGAIRAAIQTLPIEQGQGALRHLEHPDVAARIAALLHEAVVRARVRQAE